MERATRRTTRRIGAVALWTATALAALAAALATMHPAAVVALVLMPLAAACAAAGWIAEAGRGMVGDDGRRIVQ